MSSTLTYRTKQKRQLVVFQQVGVFPVILFPTFSRFSRFSIKKPGPNLTAWSGSMIQCCGEIKTHNDAKIILFPGYPKTWSSHPCVVTPKNQICGESARNQRGICEGIAKETPCNLSPFLTCSPPVRRVFLTAFSRLSLGVRSEFVQIPLRQRWPIA